MTVHSYLDLRVVFALIEERQVRLDRTSLLVSDRHFGRWVRRWIGGRLFSLGSGVAN